jgi:hypothetical protein
VKIMAALSNVLVGGTIFILIGLIIYLKPAFFMHVFRPRGALTNDPTRVKTFFQVHGKEKGIFWTKITGMVFALLGVLAILLSFFGLI